MNEFTVNQLIHLSGAVTKARKTKARRQNRAVTQARTTKAHRQNRAIF